MQTRRVIRAFQLTAARRRLVLSVFWSGWLESFQLTAARRRLAGIKRQGKKAAEYFNSQPREGGWSPKAPRIIARPKFQLTAARRRLGSNSVTNPTKHNFNSQPREGGWLDWRALLDEATSISTHSRAKAAGPVAEPPPPPRTISTHSRAKAAGHNAPANADACVISTHSRAKAAGGRS